jgi:hypothetical protein
MFRQVFYCTPTQNRLKPEPISLDEVSLSQIVKRVDYLYKQDNCEIKQIDLDLLSNLIYQRSRIDDNWNELVKNLKNDCIDYSVKIDGNQIDKLKEFFFYNLV